MPLLKLVMHEYIQMSGGEDEDEAARVLVKDLVKESSSRILSSMLLEHLKRLAVVAMSKVRLNPSDIFDAEARFFLQPEAVRSFGASRALLMQREKWSYPQAIKLCRKSPHLLYALMMTALPRPLFLGGGLCTANDTPPATPDEVNALVAVLLANQAWLNLWQVDGWLLAQLAASSPTFADAMVTELYV